MIKLDKNRYGKARVRLVKVIRQEGLHDMFEWNVFVTVTGDFETCFTEGDNSKILPTDTMKNTIYSLARDSSASCIEDFAKQLIAFFLDWNSQIESVRVEIEQKPWKRILADGSEHPAAFQQSGPEVWTTRASGSRSKGVKILSGIKGLVILKTANSGFSGFIRDGLTTLPETADRLLGTEASAIWNYASADLAFEALRPLIVSQLLATFANHDSLSVQQTLFAMGKDVLDSISEVLDIELTLPNRHCLLVNLAPFGQDNPNMIYVPTDEPSGYIEAKLVRSK